MTTTRPTTDHGGPDNNAWESTVPDHRYTGPNHRDTTSDKLDDELETAVKHSDTIRQVFYIAVLLVALGGQVSGAVEALGLPWYIALPAVAVAELGGVVIMSNADVRRRLGERATGSRILSAGIAAFAVVFNWLAHSNKLMGGFFAGMSLIGYCVYLIHTENKRRDRLRAKKALPPTTPAYELFGHWIRHPLLTRRARSLAKADPNLDLYTSLAAARDEIIEERRLAAIAKIVGRRMRRTAQSKDHADLAVAAYPLDQLATRVADRADLDAIAADIATEMTPRAAAGPRPGWANLNPWKWSTKLSATLAALTAERDRALAEAATQHAQELLDAEFSYARALTAQTARSVGELTEEHMRAVALEWLLDTLRADTAHTIQTMRAAHAEELRAAADTARAQTAQEYTAQAARDRAQAEEARRAEAAEAERAARARAAEQAAAQKPKPAARTGAHTPDQRKPGEVSTLRTDEAIAAQMWDAYEKKMRADGEPLKEYRVRVDGKCADRQAKRVLAILAARWSEQAAQSTARSTAQDGAQPGEQGEDAPRAEVKEEAS